MSAPTVTIPADEIVVGIDLGTTYSAIAYVDEHGEPRIIEVEHGNETLPSVVEYSDQGVVVGEKALRKSIADKTRVIRWVKRKMGEDEIYVIRRAAAAGEEVTEGGGQDFSGDVREFRYTPQEVSSEILKTLKAEAERHLGRPVRYAVITVPAWFNAKARDATEEAAKLAGFEVLRLIEEPTAAAVYWGLRNLNEGETVAVYDLGGGTFDLSILRYQKGELERLGTNGHRELGGHDWTSALMDKVLELAAESGEYPQLDAEEQWDLYEQCESKKRRFPSEVRDGEPSPPQVFVVKYKRASDGEPVAIEVNVTREQFDEWTYDLLQRTLGRCENAFNKSDLHWGSVDHVLLVGGSTRMHQVRRQLRALSGEEIVRIPGGGKEDTMVALGAAIMANDVARCGKGKTRDRAQRALGVVTLGGAGGPKYRNEIMIKEGAELPAVATNSRFATVVPNQKLFKIPIVEGGEPDATLNMLYQTFEFQCLPGSPAGSKVEVTFGYDESNQIDVKARDVRTGQELPGEPSEFTWPQGGSGGLVELCFVVDATGSMAGCIHGVKQQIADFCNAMAEKGLGYRLGGVAYRDLRLGESMQTFEWSEDVSRFLDWLRTVQASGGGDEPESALDGLAAAAEFPQTQGGARRVLVLVTDATCHVPDQSRRSAEAVGQLLAGKEIRVFGIAPDFPAYRTIVEATGGRVDLVNDEDSDLLDFKKYFQVARVDIPLFRSKLQSLGGRMIDELLQASAE